jgi:hypothetical protein
MPSVSSTSTTSSSFSSVEVLTRHTYGWKKAVTYFREAPAGCSLRPDRGFVFSSLLLPILSVEETLQSLRLELASLLQWRGFVCEVRFSGPTTSNGGKKDNTLEQIQDGIGL